MIDPRKVAAIATLCLGLAAPAIAAEATIRLSHFWPATSEQNKDIFEAWAKTVEAQSGGRLKVEVYPSQTLTKAAAAYDGVKSRISEMAATAQGYTANRFPLTQVVELPGLFANARQGSCTLQALYDEGALGQEYKDTHVLFLFTHGPGHLHTTAKLVQKPGDLAGMRIRRPTPVVGEMLEELGAQPVGMPAPQTYESLQRGVIDGASMPWEGSLVFRLHEQAHFHTELNLYTLAFVATMNAQVYAGLPADLKKVIDDNSGQAWAAKAAAVFDDLDVKGRAQAGDGHQVVTIAGGADNADWRPILAKATDKYLTELEAKGLPARAIHARARALVDGPCR